MPVRHDPGRLAEVPRVLEVNWWRLVGCLLIVASAVVMVVLVAWLLDPVLDAFDRWQP